MVMNVEVETASSGSVRVSWDSLDIPEITGYIVYYNQKGITDFMNVTVPTNSRSVVIGGLMSNVEYQFQVAAVADYDGAVIIGEKSAVATWTKISGLLL